MADELARVVAAIGMLAGNPLLGTDWDRLLRQEFEKEYWRSLQSCIKQNGTATACTHLLTTSSPRYASPNPPRTRAVLVGMLRAHITAPGSACA